MVSSLSIHMFANSGCIMSTARTKPQTGAFSYVKSGAKGISDLDDQKDEYMSLKKRIRSLSEPVRHSKKGNGSNSNKRNTGNGYSVQPSIHVL
jgi:hypothetical protein